MYQLSRLKLSRLFFMGSTLVELLVVMIVTGVVFMSVMDGLELFHRYASRVALRITANSAFYESYYRFENIVSEADSITGRLNDLRVWAGGMCRSSLSVEDSMLYAVSGDLTDTLFTGITALWKKRAAESHKPDSVYLTLIRNDKVNMGFSVKTPVAAISEERICTTEKEYLYDPE